MIDTSKKPIVEPVNFAPPSTISKEKFFYEYTSRRKERLGWRMNGAKVFEAAEHCYNALNAISDDQKRTFVELYLLTRAELVEVDFDYKGVLERAIASWDRLMGMG